MGRRKRDEFESLVAGVVFVLFFFGAAIVAFLKQLLFLGLALGLGAGLAFCIYRLARACWERLLDVSGFIPEINWQVPALPGFANDWEQISYPEFPRDSRTSVQHMIGTSGAWKDVLSSTGRYPALRDAASCQQLQSRLRVIEASSTEILARSVARAQELAQKKCEILQQDTERFRKAATLFYEQVQPQLENLRSWIAGLEDGTYLDRRQASRLRPYLRQYESRFEAEHNSLRDRARRHEDHVRTLLDAASREKVLRKKLADEIAAMKQLLASREFAGAAAEMAVTEELENLSIEGLVFNDVTLRAERYIHYQGKPLMSAQIDTLVITAAGVFIIEVKNWSRQFAASGDGFNPYEQASRSSYLVYDQLRSAGLSVKTRAIIATNGHLPEKGEYKVAVVSIGRVRGYIENCAPVGVDISRARTALGL